MNDLSPCAAIVREHDYDRYVCTMFAPPEHREALFALYAFNYEIAKTREVVSDTTLGLIRLTWWREAIEEIFDGKTPRKHEVVEPLARAIKAYNLPQERFERLIYAREFDLEDVPPADLRGLEKYIEYTVGPLNDLAIQILGGVALSDQQKRHLSQVIGQSGLLRALPFFAAQYHCMVPEDMLTAEGLTKYDVFRGDKVAELRGIILDLVSHARSYYADLNMQPEYKSLYLQARIAKHDLNMLQKRDYNPYVIEEGRKPPMLRLLWAYYRGRL